MCHYYSTQIKGGNTIKNLKLVNPSVLDERAKKIVELALGGISYSDIGEQFSLSRQRIEQILQRSIEKSILIPEREKIKEINILVQAKQLQNTRELINLLAAHNMRDVARNTGVPVYRIKYVMKTGSSFYDDEINKLLEYFSKTLETRQRIIELIG
jgi:transposase